MLRFHLLLTGLILFSASLGAQVVTTTPPIVQTDTKDITITFHADRGNRGLAGMSSTTAIYAHTGVITSESTGDNDWKYATSWNVNNDKYRLKYAGPDTWTLTIPDINTFYGITDPSVTVTKLAFVFRNANGSREGKEADGGDIFVKVLPPGFQMELTSSAGEIVGDSNPVTFTVNTTAPADIDIRYYPGANHIAEASGVSTLTGTASFTREGDYTVTATAVSGGNTVTRELRIVRTAPAARLSKVPWLIPTVA